MFKTKIGICDASFFAFHGYYPEERKMGTHFIINLDVEISIETKDLDSTVNYENLFSICKNQMYNTQLLIESVAKNIIDEITLRYNHVDKIHIRIDKIGAQLGGSLKSAFVEMSHEIT